MESFEKYAEVIANNCEDVIADSDLYNESFQWYKDNGFINFDDYPTGIADKIFRHWWSEHLIDVDFKGVDVVKNHIIENEDIIIDDCDTSEWSDDDWYNAIDRWLEKNITGLKDIVSMIGPVQGGMVISPTRAQELAFSDRIDAKNSWSNAIETVVQEYIDDEKSDLTYVENCIEDDITDITAEQNVLSYDDVNSIVTRDFTPYLEFDPDVADELYERIYDWLSNNYDYIHWSDILYYDEDTVYSDMLELITQEPPSSYIEYIKNNKKYTHDDLREYIMETTGE